MRSYIATMAQSGPTIFQLPIALNEIESMGSQWKLPPGVSPGTQEYFESDTIAEDYDRYFEYTSLFQFDQSILQSEFGEADPKAASVIADFGCGTGRALIGLGEIGYRGLAIDMSESMLKVVQQKAEEANVSIDCVEANLVQMEGLRDKIVDHGVCLFSTLGMIEGHANRLTALRHFRRLIRDQGKLILHVHNYWYNLYDPGGPWWMMRNAWRRCVLRSEEIGDRTYPYRGVYNMFLHVFRRSEIRRMLVKSGFRKTRFLPLNAQRMTSLKRPWWFSGLRCNGWIIVAE